VVRGHEIETPAFMPVGTQASVKSLTPAEVRATGAQIILNNAYHLYLRPGVPLVEHCGGLHRFQAWDGAILTDSGGYQIFSLSSLHKVTEEGLTFRSHIDGSEHFMSPEKAIETEQRLGADIIMSYDQPIPWGASRTDTIVAPDRTHRWAARGKAAWDQETGQALYGIVQGGFEEDLRRQSAQHLAELAFHFARSGDRARGAVYAQRAAEQAMSAYAPEDAMAHYQAALELAGPPATRRGDLLLGLGEAALLPPDAGLVSGAVASPQLLAPLRPTHTRKSPAPATDILDDRR
jgi:tRNA-guanine transglycosylase